MRWLPVTKEIAQQLGGRAVLFTNRPENLDDEGVPKFKWVGSLFVGTCGQVNAITSHPQAMVRSVTHYCEIPKMEVPSHE